MIIVLYISTFSTMKMSTLYKTDIYRLQIDRHMIDIYTDYVIGDRYILTIALTDERQKDRLDIQIDKRLMHGDGR